MLGIYLPPPGCNRISTEDGGSKFLGVGIPKKNHLALESWGPGGGSKGYEFVVESQIFKMLTKLDQNPQGSGKISLIHGGHRVR